MMQKPIYSLFLVCFICFASAQSKLPADSAAKLLDEIIVTATKTESKASNIPLPIEVISARNVQMSGSQKLIDILEMQSGLIIANNPLGTSLQGYPNPFGDGIQMQGLDPAYTLILVDGEPLTGRNAGIINLGRVAIGNIRQIEILKGPATSLYGSDALAGVINIITEKPKKNNLDLQAHYATNNTLGLTLASNIKFKKTAFQFFMNRYSSEGYDLDRSIYGKTIDPFVDYSIAAKFIYDISEKSEFTLSARYFSDKQFNNYLIYPELQAEVVEGTTAEKDKSLYGRLQHKVNNKLNYFTSVYATAYNNDAAVYLQKNDSLYEEIRLRQFLLRPEIQVNVGADPASLLVAGAGYNFESVNSTRYSSLKQMDSYYLFVQKQFHWKEKANIILGARFDKNLLYPAQLSPKIAMAYKLNPGFILKGSIGAGFKAPDFRQQFLDFSNSLIGYTLLGARELGHGLETLRKNGQIDQSIDINPFIKTKDLVPEKSIGINAGAEYIANDQFNIKANFFRNDISNLIETYNLPFSKINNQAIYSYTNLNKVFTEGLEISSSLHLHKNLSLYGGYQYLIAKDKEVLQLIKNEKLYKRDPFTNVTTLVTRSEYKGLYNRSRNTANLRLQYNNITYKASGFIAVKYRGRYGFNGLNGFQNGNNVLDDDREFVNGFLLLNTTLSKQVGKHWQIQAGIENILDYTNKLQMPNMFGRSFFINCNFKLENKKK